MIAWPYVLLIGFCCFFLGAMCVALCAMVRDADERMMKMREEGDGVDH